jgi:hypothetical protein
VGDSFTGYMTVTEAIAKSARSLAFSKQCYELGNNNSALLHEMAAKNWLQGVSNDRLRAASAFVLEQKAVVELAAAVKLAEAYFPLPRCKHGSALADHAGEQLEPSCGCRRTTP